MAGDYEASFPLRVGAIDVGSNAIRYMASEFSAPKRFEVLDQIRCPVRLGHDVFLTGRLAPDALDAAVAAIVSFRKRIDELGVTQHRAVATSAVRDSKNGEDLIKRVRKEADIELEVITGAEEARLAHIAVCSRIDLGRRHWALADLGGGSVEVSIVDETGIHWTESHGMGSVRLLEELAVAGDEPGRFRRRLEEYTATLRLPASVRTRLAGFIATGGNIEALARLIDAKPDARGVSVIETSKLRSTIEALARLSYQQRVDQLGLREDRADVILPAAMVYERLAELAGMECILVPNVGIKDGVLLDLVENLVPEGGSRSRLDEIAWDGATTLGRRYSFDQAHGQHVAQLAISLFDQLTELHELAEDDRRLLLAAAILHDVGTFIGYRRHHKHSQYIIAESDLPGFSPSDIQVIANVARYHRKSPPASHHEPFTKLSEGAQEKVRRLAPLLRLADALDREHRQTVHSVLARVQDSKLELELTGDGDLLLERWALQQKASMFENVYDLEVEAKE
jgi:exopolyphosphatase/guanosine-5'-triphosphate,3'-diphosphate pyrophosphatase